MARSRVRNRPEGGFRPYRASADTTILISGARVRPGWFGRPGAGRGTRDMDGMATVTGVGGTAVAGRPAP